MPADLSAPGAARVPLYIDGAWRAGGAEPIALHNPATGEAFGEVGMADAADMDAALGAAARGFEQWRQVSAGERAGLLSAVGQLLRERAALIAKDLTTEQGKPIAQARGEVMATAAYFDGLAGDALRLFGRTVPTEADGTERRIMHAAIGPVFAVSPWNLPAMMAGRKIANSLAAGCSIIVKPAKETPLTAAHLAHACHDAGIPAGVVNIVTGASDAMSRRMIQSDVIAKISFTGSTEVGKELAALAGAHMKKATMELGGHAPVIVCADADLDRTLAMLLAGRFANAGQSCLAPTRFLIARPLYAEFAERFAAGARALRVGDGHDPQTAMGPLAGERRLAVMDRLVADATSKGATLLAGGTRLDRRGWFYAPTVLADVPADAAIMQEEPFGPVTPIVPFDDVDEAIARANNTRYGLSAYILSRDLGQANRIAQRIEAGLVGINSLNVAAPSVPFGGVRDSGVGREAAIEGLLESMTTRTISVGIS